MFRHFLITRFNVTASFGRREQGPPLGLDDRWLEHRLDLFTNFCLPSVCRQANGSFQWIVALHAATPRAYVNLLSERCRDACCQVELLRWPTFFVSGCIEYIIQNSPGATHIVTTRLDNDDCIHKDFMANVQDSFAERDRHMVAFERGYTYNVTNRNLRSCRYAVNPFVSLIEVKSAKMTTVYCGDHRYLGRNCSLDLIPHEGAWLQTIHEANISNREYGHLVAHGMVDLKEDFGIHVDAALGP